MKRKVVLTLALFMMLVSPAFTQDDVPVFTEEDLGGSSSEMTLEGGATDTIDTPVDIPYDSSFYSYVKGEYVDPTWLTVGEYSIAPAYSVRDGVRRQIVFWDEDYASEMISYDYHFTIKSPGDTPARMRFDVQYQIRFYFGGILSGVMEGETYLGSDHFETRRTESNGVFGMYGRSVEERTTIQYAAWKGAVTRIIITSIRIR